MKTKDIQKSNPQNKILTIPNLLSIFRLCLIPVMVRLYIAEKNYTGTILVLILSAATDIADGFIARHFNMTSDLGKVLDPVADKFTQGIMLICLITRFPLMSIPLAVMAARELLMGITGYMVIKRRDTVMGAEWYGKAATVCLYASMALHIVWYDITPAASLTAIILSTAMIALSFTLYMVRNLTLLRGGDKNTKEAGGK